MNFYKEWTVVGLLDSDGGFNIRLTERKDNKVGCSIAIAFSQKTKNKEVVERVKEFLNSETKIVDVKSNNKKETSTFTVAFDSKPGQKMFDVLKRKSSFSPSKYKDYLIGLIFFEYLKNKYILKEIESKDLSLNVQEKISSVAIIFLLYQMSNESNPNSKSRKRIKKAKDWLNYLQPSNFEFEEGNKLLNFLINLSSSFKIFLKILKKIIFW